MARIRTRGAAGLLLAAPLAAGLLIAGAGSAAADDDGTLVSNAGTGNVFGSVDGNHISTQQTATGAGASNQSDTLAVKDNAGTVQAGQANKNYTIVFAPVFS
ncbi:hypothetical protein ACFXAF_33445 [Kitasatospora sp. NPDC059463]|uniref:hypothetical protein n=1 Tax=unclassified Kitasatospora TaxID=2633591 RepID=UPI00369166BD